MILLAAQAEVIAWGAFDDQTERGGQAGKGNIGGTVRVTGVDTVIFSGIFSEVGCCVPVRSLLTPVALISLPLLWPNTLTKASWEGDKHLLFFFDFHFQITVTDEGRCAGLSYVNLTQIVI